MSEDREELKKEIEESIEIKTLKREIANLKKRLVSRQAGENLILAAVQEAFEKPVNLKAPPAPPRQRKKSKEIAVLHLSDIHIGKTTPTYNSEIAELRLLELAEKTIEITETRRNSASISELHIYLGGDIIEGEIIFAHQAHEIDQSTIVQAVITAPTILGRIIMTFLSFFSKVKVVCVPGNHGRPASKKSGYSKATNWDNAVYMTLKHMLIGPSFKPNHDIARRLEIVGASEDDINWYQTDQIYNWGSLLVHGDQIRGGFAGFPWYGVAKKAWGWIDSIPHPWDYLWFGHFHTYASAVINHRTFLANGSSESDNPFAREVMAAAGWPCQRLAFFNENHGLIADHQVFLTDDRIPNKEKAISWLGLNKPRNEH